MIWLASAVSELIWVCGLAYFPHASTQERADDRVFHRSFCFGPLVQLDYYGGLPPRGIQTCKDHVDPLGSLRNVELNRDAGYSPEFRRRQKCDAYSSWNSSMTVLPHR